LSYNAFDIIHELLVVHTVLGDNQMKSRLQTSIQCTSLCKDFR